MEIKKVGNLPQGSSLTNEFLLKKQNSPPQITPLMVNGASFERRQMLEEEIKAGLYSSKGYVVDNQNQGIALSGIKKFAQNANLNPFSTNGPNTFNQIPEVYSPLWLSSNLNLPRDRATINGWCRAFYALNPFVNNVINLHSTYPINKLKIKCHNPEIQKFFNDMVEELDLMNLCVDIAREYFLLGEAFVYGELDERVGKWSRLVIQNPDYMAVKPTVIPNEPTIMIRPDERLKQIIKSNKPADIEQRKKLDPYIVDSIKRGQNIVLNNLYISHLARKISPYEMRGTGLPVCVFRQLMLFDKLRECYSEDTEVLTDDGFKNINDLIHKSTKIFLNPNYVNGIELDENNKISSVVTMKENFKIACFNPKTNAIEYHKPLELHVSQYSGNMIHFKSMNFDILVSPNHKMWVQERNNNSWSDFFKLEAQKLSKNEVYKFQSIAKFEGNELNYVNLFDKQVPIELYLKFIGYFISFGSIVRNNISFKLNSNELNINNLKDVINKFVDLFNIKIEQNENKKDDLIKYSCKINSKIIANHFSKEIYQDKFKIIPNWVKQLNNNSLNILLNVLNSNNNSDVCKYYTQSKQLADDIQEIAFKCENYTYIKNKILKSKNIEYSVYWSSNKNGNDKLLGNNLNESSISETKYFGLVWCFEVPTGLFVTRRNGTISIHGNSKFAQADNMVNPMTLIKIGSPDYKPSYSDIEAYRETWEAAQNNKDFKIFTTDAVAVEKIGSGQGIYDISGDITQLIKEILIGLEAPPVLMDGGADTTYANGSVALDALRQRYMQFRNMLSAWLKRKIFAPISKINEFYEVKDGKKHLIIPEVEWNHMSLFDTADYIANLVTLTSPTSGAPEGSPNRASVSTLYQSLGLDEEDERRKIRKEAIFNEIYKKEVAALSTMTLNELRSLDENEDISEAVEKEEPVPGQESSGGGSAPEASPLPPPPELK